jgi:hypothetical protein
MSQVYTIIETPLFSRLAADYWTEDERGAFATWLSGNPKAGDVIPASGGIRKVRWSRTSSGKRGGVRVIYFNQLSNGEIWLLLIYSKSARENIPAHVLRAIKEEIKDASE